MFAFILALTGCDTDDGSDPSVSYTVSFNRNGGSGGIIPDQTVNAGSSITLPSGSGLSKTGYAFGGWNTNSSGTGENYAAGSSYTPPGDVTLYALWGSCTVTFDLNGGTGNAPPAQSAAVGGRVTLPSGSGLSKTGYTFGGWNTSADGTGTNYSGGSYYTVSGSVTFYANWMFTVTFSLNGEPGSPPSPMTANDGSSITLPMLSGFSFSGWNTRADGTGEYYQGGSSFTVTGNITLYARFDGFIITFDANGNGETTGALPVRQQVPPGSSITIPGNGTLAIAYASFAGWNTKADGTGTNYTAGQSYTPAGSNSAITLYAKWNITTQYASLSTAVEKLNWLRAHAKSGESYEIQVTGSESVAPQFLFSNGRSGIKITVTGGGTLNLSSKGEMFTVSDGNTMVLSNITLNGISDNDRSLVIVGGGGNLEMNNGTTITGNTNIYGADAGYGGGVAVATNATFTMNGGTITGNNAGNGGGVYVGLQGTFTMNGGTITNNTASGNGVGGGVFVYQGMWDLVVVDGTFIMNVSPRQNYIYSNTPYQVWQRSGYW